MGASLLGSGGRWGWGEGARVVVAGRGMPRIDLREAGGHTCCVQGSSGLLAPNTLHIHVIVPNFHMWSVSLVGCGYAGSRERSREGRHRQPGASRQTLTQSLGWGRLCRGCLCVLSAPESKLLRWAIFCLHGAFPAIQCVIDTH